MNGAVNSPAVTVEQLTPAASAAGEAGPVPTTGTTAYTPSGTPVGVRYTVREGDDLTPSQLPDGSPHPDYPPELQPRDRSRVASAQQVNRIANNLNPERLGASASTREGAPIVGPDGVVESGNGRTLAIQQAYANGGPQADAYRSWLGAQGYDVDGMKAPVLVRERTTPMDMPQRAAFAADAGASPVMATSAAERAAADAKKLPDDLVAGYRGGDVVDPENRDFVRSFVQNVAPGDQASFATADGALSREGAQRIRAALVQRAYGDGGVTAALSETIDPQAKVLAGAMQDAAGPMARLQGGIKAGQVDPAVDLAPALVEATRTVQQARTRGISLADAVAQQDAFSRVSPQAQAVLRAAYGENLSGRMSQAKMADLLTAYAREAEQQSTSGNLFGDNLTAEQILQGASARYGKDAGQEASTATGYAGRVRPGDGGDGNQARGSGNGPSGQNPPAGSGGRAGVGILPEVTPQLTPNFDAEAADRVRAMRAAHAERKDTFGPRAPGVGQILARGTTAGTFKLPESSVPQQIFSSGAGAAEKVQAALRAGVTPAQIADYAAFDLRRAASNPDGSLDPAKAAAWRQKNAEAFQALTRADLTIGRSFDTAQQQARRLGDLQQQRADLDATHPLKPGWGDAEVMQRVWQPGPKGADSVRNAQSAAGGSPVADSSIADYAAYSLRKMAAPDGVLDPAKYQAWARTYDGALSARPDIKAQFDSAAKAQETLNQTASDHATALKDFQTGVAKHFLGGADPADRVGQILNSATRVRDMADLARLTESDPAARAGIQRAIVDHIMSRLQGNALAGQTGTQKLKSDQFQTFIKRSADAMREVMTPQQVEMLQKVAEDLQRANLSVDGTRVTGGSDTTQKAALLASGGLGTSLLNMVRANGLTGLLTLIGLKGGPVGAFIGNKAGVALSSLKAAGIKQTSDLVTEAMLNPGLARVLLANVNPATERNVTNAFVSQIARIAAARGAHAVGSVQRMLAPTQNSAPTNPLAVLPYARGAAMPQNALSGLR